MTANANQRSVVVKDAVNTPANATVIVIVPSMFLVRIEEKE